MREKERERKKKREKERDEKERETKSELVFQLINLLTKLYTTKQQQLPHNFS